MLFLILSIILSCGMGIVIRYSQTYECNMKMVTLINYIVTIGMCFYFLPEKQILPQGKSMHLVLLLGVIDGILFLGNLLFYQLNVRKNGTPLTVSFSHMGVLVPILMSILVFGEQPGKKQWIGVVLAVLAILVINLEKNSDHQLEFRMGLIILLISGGCADMMSKVFETYGDHKYANLFLFYTFTVAFFLCLLWMIITKSYRLGRREILYGIGMGVFNYGSTLLLLRALIVMPAFIVYPVYSVGVIVFINLANMVMMKEGISKRQLVGMALMGIALIFLNL